MAKIRVKNKDFELDASPYQKGGINDENYIYSLNLIEKFKNSSEYKQQTVEEIFDTLIKREDRNKQIEEVAADMTNAYFEDPKHNFSYEFGDLRAKLYKQYKANYASEYDKYNSKISDKWGKNVKELNDDVISDFYTKGIFTEFSKDGEILSFDGIFNEVNKTLNHLTKATRDKDPDHYKMLNEWRNQATAVLNYQKEIGSFDTTKEQYVNAKMESFILDYVGDKEYVKIQDKLNRKKDEYFEQKKEEIGKVYKSPLQSSKALLLERKAQCANLLKAREDLAKDYYKTSLGSRIARWVLPNSWSKAGQIQNELDKIDKFIKDAGYEKKEVENIKAEIKSEKPVIENDNLENQAEVLGELNGPETTVDLQQGIKDKTVLAEAEKNKSQVVEKEDVQKGEISVGQ